MLGERLLSWFRLSWQEYYADFLITPPLTMLALWLSLQHGFSLLWLIQFGLGLSVWTLYEYIAHRWLLHHFWIFSDLHKLHHDNQKDYIALHPAGTLIIYGLIWYLFGIQSAAIMVGFSFGYVVYSALHTAFHYASISAGNPLWSLKRHHALHHRFDDVNFGVTTSLWDHVFSTKSK